MKNKSTKHKDFNTFKFQTFAERIANIDIDIFHRIGHENESDSEDAECYFHQSIENWNMLNLTESFEEFKKEVKAYAVVTLPQLILDKDRVVEVLLKHLRLKNPLCLQPLLYITVAVAKDLRKDFHQYSKDFLEVLIDLLNTKDTELLEWTFTCLAYLFKFLWRPFLKDIGVVFNALLPLLSDNKPDYINGFAAGSFAFVARKVKDWPAFLSHVVKTVKNKKDGVEGCGKLFFEIIRGVNSQFHSCAETVLLVLLDGLSDTKFCRVTLFKILEKVVENVVASIQSQKGQLLWDCFVSRLDNLLYNWKNCPGDKYNDDIESMLKLLGQSVEFRNGKFLHDPAPVIRALTTILTDNSLSESVLQISVQICILLLTKNVKLSQEQASGIVRKVMTLPQESILLYFVDKIGDFPAFEALILPQFLTHCVKTNLNRECLRTLTQLIVRKAPLCANGINLHSWIKYPVDFNTNNVTIEKHFLDSLKGGHFEDYWCGLVCVPHLTLTDVDSFVEVLTSKMLLFLDILKSGEGSNHKQNLYILNNTIESLVHLDEVGVLVSNSRLFLDTLSPFLTSSGNVWALNTLDLLVTYMKNSAAVINIDTLLILDKVLAPNFSSPHHQVRLLTCHIYSLFEQLPEFDLRHSTDLEVPQQKFRVFSICYHIESVDPQVHTYRDQLQNLEKLNFDKPQMLMCAQSSFRTVPLRYLCGAFHINFKLLWQPVADIIESHAHGLEVQEFWEVYVRELRGFGVAYREDDKFECDWEFVKDCWEKSGSLGVQPGFDNYRLQLWKAMSRFADIAEAKTRDVSELLLEFIEKEYAMNSSEVALKWNIKQNSGPEDIEEGCEDDTGQSKEVPPKLKKGKSNFQTLLSFLAVFSKVKSPKSLYREPELSKLYFDLLQHKKSEVQKAALDCLVTYKHKFLTPYKDHLYSLIDDQKFKNEIVAFRIDKESNSIQEEHRDDLIPLILRIVLSKMSVKTGGGKASGQLRRNLVLRFLAGCEEKEMLIFVKMALRYYSKYLKDDPGAMLVDLEQSITLESFIPPKRLQSTVNLLGVIMDQFGGLMGAELLTFVLQILLIIGGALKFSLQHFQEVHGGYAAILRHLRTSSIKLVGRFFEQFDRYTWSSKQIDAVFEIFVWPHLDKLNLEGIHSPTALLKLFFCWGSNPRYFALLVKHRAGDETVSVLPHVFRLLLNEKSHVTVVNVIEEMLEKLLTLQPDEDSVMQVDDVLPVAKSILDRVKLDEKLNYGSCILLPHVSSVLKKLQRRLEGKNRNLNQRQLFILSRLSELVWEEDVSDAILKLLLPTVVKRCSEGEEVVMQLLNTVNNLLGNVGDPRRHYRLVVPLFGEVSFASGRNALLKSMGRLQVKESFIEGLNAFDAKWIDQPDFQRRQDAFKEIEKAVEQKTLDLEVGVLIVYNCYYFLKSEKDLSMRENSSHCLKSLCPYLITSNPKDLDYLLNDTLFALIRKGMDSRNNDFRNECVLLLGHLARECPDSHVVLRDLNRYTSKSDPEVDFFENITHLQLHRHGRALLKFCSGTKELTTSPNVRTLMQFVLPLASHYLCNEKYVGKNSVVDAAVECVGVVCRILPWHQYETILKYYLDKLKKNVEHQKQVVRVTVAILDAFHYDLTKAQVADDSSEVEDQEQDEAPEATEEVKVKVCEKVPVLCKSTATRVVRNIRNVLLPQLHRALAELTRYDATHKINRKKTGAEREEEDLLRVPISLALVKLLQRLPKEILEGNLPGIFMKLCTFLKSHLESVRRVTRETLQKIMQTLGPKYLHLLLGEMTPLLKRGFHVHVLVFTVHAVLSCLKQSYAVGDIDGVLLTVLQLCQADLFGTLSEEKEVARIAVKTSEAKTTKSFDTFQILAQFVTDKCLMELIVPIKNVLQTSHSYKVVHKAQECLRHVALGLADNRFVATRSMLVFAYGTASESIPELLVLSHVRNQRKETEKFDCFIIPRAPTNRSGVSNVKSSAKTNAHLLVEFGLRLCLVMLKRDMLKDHEYKPYLDPFVVVFRNCLTSKHVKLSTLALQCLAWVFKYELPSMNESIKGITDDIFAILHRYAAAGLSKGDNFDLVVAAFKAVAVLVRDVRHHIIDTEQLKILLLYAEQDIHDHERQATAFNLLKAIVVRKLIIPEVYEVMAKVAELSITSELNHVRTQSRAVFHQYLMDYPLGDKLEKHVFFYVSQMGYDMQYGRESAIEMISTLIVTFPVKTLKKHSGTLFVGLGARLVNDEVPECRRHVSQCLSQMLERLESKDKEPLFDIVTVWLKDKKLSHRQLAAQLCGLFVTSEKTSFVSKLPRLLPLLLKQFTLKELKSEEAERVRDHLLFQLLQLLLKLCSNCPTFLQMAEVEEFARHAQTLLSHPHDWVRLAAVQFLGYALSALDVEELAVLVANNESGGCGYLKREPTTTVKALTLDLCDQLQPGELKNELAEQVIKNLVFVARVLHKVAIKDGEDQKINLLWLTKRMRKIVNSEVVQCPTGTVLRTEVFKWIAAVGTVLSVECVGRIFVHLLAPLVREMITTDESNAPLRQLAKEVATLLKKRVGVEAYTNTLANLQRTLSTKRAERKRSRAQLAVTEPQVYAQKKIKRQEKKKEAKKRKLMVLKGGKSFFKRRKAVDLEPAAEV